MNCGNNRETILKVAFTFLIFSYLSDGAIISCSGTLQNIAVDEGTLNTFINFTSESKKVKWTNTATTDELDEVSIVNYDDTVDRSLTNDYAFNSSGLTIKKATIMTATGHPLSTAGLYNAECGGNRFGFKLLVIRSGPRCLCTNVSSSEVKLTCRSIYADSTYDPINAIFTWIVNGLNITSDSPQRTDNDGYTYISTSTFTTNYNISLSYQCKQTFSTPTEVQDSAVAMTAPTFSRIANCSCSGYS